MVRIEGLTKVFGKKKVAVDNLSLHIRPGEIFGFIGPNGAGKTTTLKCICGILDFEVGNIIIDGNLSIKKSPLECKKIMAYIPDNPDIYPNLKGIQYLNFIADVFNIPSNIRNEKIKEYADIFDLTNDLGSVIKSYSHGMRQKLVLIASLMHDPKLMVLDEPFVGLDPTSSYKIRKLMRDLCNKGSSIIFSTHVLETAEKVCDQIGIIKNGQMIAIGDTKSVIGDSTLENYFLELVER